MSNPLLASLNLGDVDADVNNVPDNVYRGVVYKSELLVTKDKTKVLHVIGYRIEEGEYKGRSRDEMFELGRNPVFEGPSNELVNYTPSMSDGQKPWYKARWVSLGVPDEKVGQVNFDVLVGTPVEFGVKTTRSEKGEFKNISFARKRETSSQPQPVDPNAAQATPQTTVDPNAGQPQPVAVNPNAQQDQPPF